MIRDGADAFYRWANIADGKAFEAEVARRLGDLAPEGVADATLEEVIDCYADSGLTAAEVAAPLEGALDALGGPQKEYDAYVLHVALRARARCSGILTHDFHYSVVLACLRGDRAHDKYLRSLAPANNVIIAHDIGIDPNCDDYLALRLADAVTAASCPPAPPARGSSRSSPVLPPDAQ